MVVTTVRLQKNLLKEADKLAEKELSDRTTILRQAIAKGLQALKLEYALTLYQQKKVSIGKAREIADITFWEFMDVLKERNIGFITDEEDLERQLRELKRR